MADFCSGDFAVWEASASLRLKKCMEVILCITVKFWRQYLQNLHSYLEVFISDLAAAVPLLKTDNISPVCWYIIEIWPVLMTCTWKNLVLLAVKFADVAFRRSLGSPHFAQRKTLVHCNRINRHFDFWETKDRKMEFRPLGNANGKVS